MSAFLVGLLHQKIVIQAPLDSIGADGEFSDINQYLNLTKIDSSDFVWNNRLKCFRTSEDEINSQTQGKIDLYFTIDTGSDLIQSHLPSSVSTLSVVSDIFSSSSSEHSKISSCSSLLTKAELIYSSNSLDTSSFGSSAITGTKEEGTWKESFNLSDLSEIGKASTYYFAIRYTFSPDNNADFFTSNLIVDQTTFIFLLVVMKRCKLEETKMVPGEPAI